MLRHWTCICLQLVFDLLYGCCWKLGLHQCTACRKIRCCHRCSRESVVASKDPKRPLGKHVPSWSCDLRLHVVCVLYRHWTKTWVVIHHATTWLRHTDEAAAIELQFVPSISACCHVVRFECQTIGSIQINEFGSAAEALTGSIVCGQVRVR